MQNNRQQKILYLELNVENYGSVIYIIYTEYICLSLFLFLGRFRFLLQVAIDKESTEQIEVGTIHKETLNNDVLVNETISFVIIQVIIKAETGSNDSNDHLNDLDYCDEDWVEPFWSASDSHQEVIKVHDRVYEYVYWAKEWTSWGSSDILQMYKHNRGLISKDLKNYFCKQWVEYIFLPRTKHKEAQ